MMRIERVEIENRILAELCEAGFENVFALLNSISERSGMHDEVALFQQATEELTHRNLVTLSTGHATNNRLLLLDAVQSLQEIGKFSTYFVFRESDRHWTDSRKSGPPFTEPFPYVVLTAEGKKAGAALLKQRGYDWWREKAGR